VLIVYLDPQQFESERYQRAFGIIGHASHLPHGGNAPRAQLRPPHCDHALEVAIGQRMVVHGVMQRYAQGLRLRFLSSVDAVDGLLPEI
jgi:hypothetical protein